MYFLSSLNALFFALADVEVQSSAGKWGWDSEQGYSYVSYRRHCVLLYCIKYQEAEEVTIDTALGGELLVVTVKWRR